MRSRRFDLQNPDHPPAGPQRIPRPEGWKPGRPRRWRQPTRERIDAVIGDLDPVVSNAHAEAMKPSAVLALLAPGADGYDLLLTRRAERMSNHSGELSFVGGRLDAGESPIEAALREANEEVALDPSLVTVHGQLEHFSTWVSSSHIVPVVGTVDSKPALTPQPAEVDRLLWVPVSDLTRPGVFHGELWPIDATRRESEAIYHDDADSEIEISFFELYEPFHETLWGATARMVINLLDRL